MLFLAAAWCLPLHADELQLTWQQSPDDGLAYLGTGNTERGVAYNPVTGHVLVVSRLDNEIHILDGETGADLGLLTQADIVTGGTFPRSLIGVADDGAIYLANLTTGSATSPFKVYRWENEEAAAPTIAYEGDPSGGDASAVRWGDSFDVRGSGANTQLAAGSGSAGTLGAIFTTTDGETFTATPVSNFAANSVAFGSGNTIWVKRSGAALRQVEFNLATGEGTVLRTVPGATVPLTAVGLSFDPVNNILGVVNILAGADEFRLYDASILDNLIGIDQESFPADYANGNAAGASDIHGDIVVALDTNNGLVAYRIIESVSPVEFVAQPASIEIVEGAIATLSANVGGTPPIALQWQLNGANVANATNVSLVLSNIALAQGGTYRLVASNAAGAITSEGALVSVLPRSDRVREVWKLAPGSRPYLTTGNTERGIAYNKASNRVLLVSRTGDINIHVLDGDTGEDLWTLQAPEEIVTGSAPGGFPLNMIGVAGDGVVYAANLDNASGATFTVYRWENDTTNAVPTIAWQGAPVDTRRFGDTMDVRGAGVNTEILFATQNNTRTDDNIAVIMNTTDGLNFTPNLVTIPGLDDDYLRLGIAFGSSNTFWGKTSGQPLRKIEYDLATGIGTIVQTYSNVTASATAVSVHPASNLVAVVSLETPDTVRVYDINRGTEALTLVDQEYFATDNANGNGTGSADFGDDRLYVLDTNNGILALRLAGPGTTPPTQFTNVRRSGGNIAFTIASRANSSVRLQSTTDFSSWTDGQTVQTDSSGNTEVSIAATDHHRFFRALEQ